MARTAIHSKATKALPCGYCGAPTAGIWIVFDERAKRIVLTCRRCTLKAIEKAPLPQLTCAAGGCD